MTKKIFSLFLVCLLILSCMCVFGAENQSPLLDEGITVAYTDFTEVSGAEGNFFPAGASASAGVNVAKAGLYKVLVSAQETSGENKLSLDVNASGEPYSVSFEASKNFYTAGCFQFAEGDNTVSFVSEADVHIDSITVVSVDIELGDTTTVFESEKFAETNISSKGVDAYHSRTDSGVDNIGAIQYNNNDLWASYRVYSSGTALYDISMKCYNLKDRNVFAVTDAGGNEITTGEYVNENEYLFKDVTLTEGLNEIRVKSKSGLFVSVTQTNSVYSYELEFTKTKSVGEYEISSVEETVIDPTGFLSKTEGTEKSGTAILMSGQGSATYVLKAERAGYYKIILDGQTTAEASAEINVSCGESTHASKFIDRARRNTGGRFYLEAGKNNLTLKVSSGAVKITNIRVKFVEFDVSDENVVAIPAQDYWQTTTSETDFVDNQYSGYSLTTEEIGKLQGAVAVVNEGSTTYILNVPSEGIYRLSMVVTMTIESVPFELTVNDKVIGTKRLVKTDAEKPYVYSDLGVVSLKAGQNTFKVRDTSGTGDYIFLYGFGVQKESGIIDVEGIKVSDAFVNDGDSISKGADIFSVVFTDEFDGNTFNSQNVTLTSNGKTVDAIYQTEGKVGYVISKKALDADAFYTLSVEGVTDKFGIYTTSSHKYTFKTDVDGEGYSKILIDSAKFSDELAVITGFINTKRDTGIEGRKVVAYYHEGNSGTYEYASETISKENGEFEITFNMPQGSQTGTYMFKLEGDFVIEPTEKALTYLSPDTRTEIFDKLKAAETASEAEAVLRQYENELAINLTSDLTMVPDKDKFYVRFSKQSFSGYEDFSKAYYSNIALETINQTSSGGGEFVVEALLSNETVCEIAELDSQKASYIVTNRNAFLGAIADLNEVTQTTLKEKFDALTNTYLAKEYLKAETEILAENKSVYVGAGFDILLDLKDAQAEVAKIEYEITTQTAGLFDGAIFEGKDGISAKTDFQDNKITVAVESDDGNVKDVGAVKLIANDRVGQSPVNVTARIIYDVGIPYEIVIPVADKDVTVSISVNKTDAPLKESISNSRGSGGGGGSGSFVPNITIPEPPVQATGDEFAFVDLGSVSWAEESINTLLKKGIISESEDRKFNPNDNVKREEFAKMLVLSLELTKPGDEIKTFTDVKSGDWFYDYVHIAASHGLINGYDDGSFGSGKYITREEMATLVYRILIRLGAKKPESGEAFADSYLISDYAKEAVSAVKEYEIMNGVGDNMFAPKNFVTRAMSAKVIFNMLKAVGK